MKQKSKFKLISYTNRKLGELPSFALPTSICNGGCNEQGCKDYCYAKRMERIWTTCKKKWDLNFQASLKKDFVKKVCKELRYDHYGMVRWHVSGDAYSQEYLNKIFEITNKFPQKKFFMFTKATNLEWGARPANINVILSDDKLIWKDLYHKYDGVATIMFPGHKLPQGFVLCGHQAIGMKCETCKLCLQKEIKIAFKKH